MRGSSWNVDPVRILTRRELAAVLCDLTRRGATSCSARLNRTILRLACCSGLRVSEIAGLRLGDVTTEGGRPHLHRWVYGGLDKRSTCRIVFCGFCRKPEYQ